MATSKHNAQDIITAIEKSGGIKATIAKRLGVHRHTVDNYLERYPTARQAYNDEVESIGDLAETVIIKALQAEDIPTAKWYANNKLKDRGYVTKIEGDLRNLDLSNLTIEQLERLANGEDLYAVLANKGAS